MTVHRRINLYGGPGCGKSTAAHFLMWRLKRRGEPAELSREWIKRIAYQGPIKDRVALQVQAVAGQMTEELEAIATGAIVVSESPLLMQAAYAVTASHRDHSVEIARHVERMHPGRHILLRRHDKPYVPKGRWGGEAEAIIKDDDIYQLLQESGFEFTTCRHDDWNKLWDAIQV